MAKLLGAGPIIAAASTRKKAELAKGLGAGALVNHTEEDRPEQVNEATGGEGADLIPEMGGGDFALRPSVPGPLRSDGRLRGGKLGVADHHRRPRAQEPLGGGVLHPAYLWLPEAGDVLAPEEILG